MTADENAEADFEGLWYRWRCSDQRCDLITDSEDDPRRQEVTCDGCGLVQTVSDGVA